MWRGHLKLRSEQNVCAYDGLFRGGIKPSDRISVSVSVVYLVVTNFGFIQQGRECAIRNSSLESINSLGVYNRITKFIPI